MKCVLVGAGSFVFAPTVLDDLYRVCGENATLFLVDTDLPAAERMARVAARVAKDAGLSPDIRAARDWNEALDGADAVFFSAAIQGKKRYMTDADILRDEGLDQQARECGGLGGLSYSLRTCSLALNLCADMRKRCPDAWLLDAANPMPRVAYAANRFGGIRALGFCSAAVGRYGECEQIARALGRAPREVRVVAAGVNHFSFLVSARDAMSDEDLMPRVEEMAARGALGEDRRYFFEQYGGVCMLPANHAADFVAEVPGYRHVIEPPFHGDENERMARIGALEDVARGGDGWDEVVYHSSWEHPGQVACALLAGKTCGLAALNVPNEGNIPAIAAGEYVETPASVYDGAVHARKNIILPGRTGEICRRVSHVNALAAEAAATGDRAVLDEILRVDPALEKCEPAAAKRALSRMLEAHADCLPQFK